MDQKSIPPQLTKNLHDVAEALKNGEIHATQSETLDYIM